MKRMGIYMILATMSLMAASCKKEEEPVTEAPTTTAESTVPVVTAAEILATDETEEAIPEGMMKSYLTGEIVPIEIGTRRPLAAQIDNEKAAMPQNGVSSAEVVYEVPIEANEVRLTMIMQDYDSLTRFGPLRSVRSYHPGIVAEWDAIFFHHGHSDLALTYLRADNFDDIDGVENSGYPATYQADDHSGYHKTFSTPEKINERIAKLGYRTAISDTFSYKFQFAKASAPTLLTDGQDAKKVTIGYKQNKPWFEYNETDGLYYRYAYGEAHIDQENDQQVKVTNLIVQYCDYNLEWDKDTKNIHTVGTGSGWYITGGKAVPIHWSKADYWENTHYTYENGEEIELNPGQSWVCIVLPSLSGEIVIE